jgi:hypothetical protein
VAERGKPTGKPDLTPDTAAPPPGEPPDTISIYGILGESGIASSVRLYLDRELSTYYDIPIEGITGREKVPADKSPLGVDSTLLLVRKGIRLVVHRVDSRTLEEEFVAGDFTAPGSFTPPAAAAGQLPGLPQQQQFFSPETWCFSRCGCTKVPRCGSPSDVVPCAEVTHDPQVCGIVPPTRLLGCGKPSEVPRCAPTLPLGCGQPSIVPRCPPTFVLGCGPATLVPRCPPRTIDISCRPSIGIACTIQGCGPLLSAPGNCPTVDFCPSVAGCPSEICGDPFP